MASKWKLFKEKLPSRMNPMWVLWDDSGEYLFRTGGEALKFVNQELSNRAYARFIEGRRDAGLD